MNEKLFDINYVRDALKERLPEGWSLNRTQHDAETARYRWTKWATGQECVVDVHEGYLAAVPDVDFLCDQLTEGVMEAFGDTKYPFQDRSPILPERIRNGQE